MGCSGSKATPPPAQSAQPVQAAPLQTVAPPAGSGGNKGKGKGKGSKGKGKGKGKAAALQQSAKDIKQIMQGKFQIMLSGKWTDYENDEDQILKKAFLVGQPNCKFQLRGASYFYDFKSKVQKNEKTGKEREIRPPHRMAAPKKPLLPQGPMVVCTIPKPLTKSMEISDPNNPGKKILVALPPNATPGMRIAVPVPDKGENVQEVAKRQAEWSKGSKMAVGMVAVGGLAVGGVVLGEHLSGGAISAWGEDVAADAADFYADSGAADWVAGAAEDVGDAAAAAGDWATGAAEDAGDWATGAAEDVGDWAGGAAGDVGDWAGDAADSAGDFAADAGDWFGDAADDAGDFIMNLF